MARRSATPEYDPLRDRVALPIEVEHFLTNVLGRSLHGTTGFPRTREWRGYCTRLFDHLQRYVDTNLVTDATHRDHVQHTLRSLKDAVRKQQAREALLVTGLVRLCLLLLGDFPNHWQKKVVNRPEYFALDRFRTVHYSQSPEQRAKLIWRTAIYPRIEKARRSGPDDPDAERWNSLYDRLDRRGRHAVFITSFRRESATEFARLFG